MFVLWYFIVFVRVHGLMLPCPRQVTRLLLHFGCGFSFLSVFLDFPFFEATLERSLTRPCGSTAADSSSADGGTCTGARSRDLVLCCLLELPGSSSGSVAGSWTTIGRIGGTRGVCGALCVRMHSITRSGPLPLSLFLWRLIITIVTDWNWFQLRLG